MFENLLEKRLSRNCNDLHDIENKRHNAVIAAIEQQEIPLDFFGFKRKSMLRDEDRRHACRRMQISKDICTQAIAGRKIDAGRCSWNVVGRAYDSLVTIPQVINAMHESDKLKY